MKSSKEEEIRKADEKGERDERERRREDEML